MLKFAIAPKGLPLVSQRVHPAGPVSHVTGLPTIPASGPMGGFVDAARVERRPPPAAPAGSQPAGHEANLFAGLGDTMARGLSMPAQGRNVYASYRAGMKRALEHFDAK